MEVDLDNNDKLSIKRIAGGSIIKYQPVFSQDGEILFIVWDNIVRAYSAQTGEWIRDLDGGTAEIVNVQLDMHNHKVVRACTVTGQILSWKWKSGVVAENSQLQLGNINASVRTFHLIDLDDKLPYGLITWAPDKGACVLVGIFDLVHGVQQIDISPQLSSQQVHVDVSVPMKFVAVAQRSMLFVRSYNRSDKNKMAKWKNAQNKRITIVRCHPLEELIATGDETGKIFIYRNLYRRGEPSSSLYHWHHTVVNALAFSESGSNFYSGGDEAVLVRWNLNQSDDKSFLPRVWGNPRHISICLGNQKIALSTSDNGIQILSAQFKPITVIQNFTWISNDHTVQDKFPIGLRVNPRTSSLMLNGRVGHLQFFSTHTRSLIYNMDTTSQNRLSLESQKVLYNIGITHAAINMDWIATGELMDDQRYSVELRLKFFRFDVGKQTYVLNTQVELPHELGLTAIEFSSPNSVDNLLCVTSGKDNVVKVWSLEHSDDVTKKDQYWMCTGRLTYKNLPIKSLAFSADSSLLSVGYGNTLCVYSSETLRLRCVLSAPVGYDGASKKITINVPTDLPESKPITKKSTKDNRSQIMEGRRKMLQLIRSFLENDDSRLVHEISNKMNKLNVSQPVSPHSQSLTVHEQELIHKKVMAHNELNFYHKLYLFDKMRIQSKSAANVEPEFNAYIRRNVTAASNIKNGLLGRAANLTDRDRFRVNRKFYNYRRRAGRRLFSVQGVHFDSVPNGQTVPLRKRTRTDSDKTAAAAVAVEAVVPTLPLPVKSVAQIQHVAFGTGEYVHLVIVCTEKRLLVWNLLTLRLQTAIKLSVRRLVVDPCTSLVAAFTVHNELYVFLPSVPILLYQRKNMPIVLGAAWIPRRYPKSQSINLDWQATTQLFFLSENQELLQLVADDDTESTSAAYLHDGNQPMAYTTFGAMIAKQIHNATVNEKQPYTGQIAIGQNGQTQVKQLTSLQTHTMVPLSLLCKGFLKALVAADRSDHSKVDDDVQIVENGRLSDAKNDSNDDEVDDDDDADDEQLKDIIESRRMYLNQSLKTTAKDETTLTDQLNTDKLLRRLMKQSLELTL